MPDEFGPHKEIINSIYEIKPEALEQIAQWVEQRGLRVPVGQVVGYQNDRQATSAFRTTQTITTSSQTDISFDGTNYDATKLWSNGSPTLITPRVPGIYHAVAKATWAAQSGGQRIVYILDSDNIAYGLQSDEATASFQAPSHTTSALIRMPLGKSIKMAVFQDSGSSVAVGAILSVALVNRFV